MEKAALKGVSFSIEGDKIALLGNNGAGKAPCSHRWTVYDLWDDKDSLDFQRNWMTVGSAHR